jgi:hypothetical protein
VLAREASRVAQQFLDICIRAVDYCPPVDLRLGEFLRAVVTADLQLIPDDSKWGYREAWIDAFRKRDILPDGLRVFSEDSLLWHEPKPPLAPIRPLSFAVLKFEGDPARPAGAHELERQARELGKFAYTPQNVECFGLALPSDAVLRGDEVLPPEVQSIRSSRRIGPDGQVLFDLVAEITQVRRVRHDRSTFEFVGGATVIIGPDGAIRYVVGKSVLSEERLEAQRQFISANHGSYWLEGNGRIVASPHVLRMVHDTRNRRP